MLQIESKQQQVAHLYSAGCHSKGVKELLEASVETIRSGFLSLVKSVYFLAMLRVCNSEDAEMGCVA